ncbi:MAG: RING finger protein [Oscillospiraceae bacterium]
MGRYANIDCPICNKPLDDDTPVVVCPTCGAPYHLECYKEVGECQFNELHEKGEDWKPPVKPMEDVPLSEAEQKYDGQAFLRCSRCGTVNPRTGICCQVCGNQLTNNINPNDQQNEMDNANIPPFLRQQGQQPFNNMSFNPFISPYGGVNPDEEIEGVKPKDLAIFIGRNTEYYLPKFKLLAKTKNRAKTLNWGAFFFTGFYFLFRKMYWQGILALVINFVLSIPSSIVMMSQISAESAMASAIPINDTILILNMLSSILVFVLRAICGFYGNTFYKTHTFKKIEQIKQQTKEQPPDVYIEQLVKKGSINMKLIFLIFGIYFASLIVLMFI